MARPKPSKEQVARQSERVHELQRLCEFRDHGRSSGLARAMGIDDKNISRIRGWEKGAAPSNWDHVYAAFSTLATSKHGAWIDDARAVARWALSSDDAPACVIRRREAIKGAKPARPAAPVSTSQAVREAAPVTGSVVPEEALDLPTLPSYVTALLEDVAARTVSVSRAASVLRAFLLRPAVASSLSEDANRRLATPPPYLRVLAGRAV